MVQTPGTNGFVQLKWPPRSKASILKSAPKTPPANTPAVNTNNRNFILDIPQHSQNAFRRVFWPGMAQAASRFWRKSSSRQRKATHPKPMTTPSADLQKQGTPGDRVRAARQREILLIGSIDQ